MANAEQNSVAVHAQQKVRPSGSDSLKLREVSKAFGGLIAVHQMSFVIHPGEIVALIGPNGSGKTTIFNLISGFLPPTHGEIWFEGRNLKGLTVLNTDSPSLSKNKNINTTKNIEARPQIKTIFSIINSLNFCMKILFFDWDEVCF